VAEAIARMEVRHAVITSVNRDEWPDKGARVWASTIREVRRMAPQTTMETLIPDVKGHWEALDLILDQKPEVVSHNMETVPRLYRQVRPQARYERSLEQLARIKQAGLRTKTGFMVGLGESPEEVRQVLADLMQCGVDVVTIGQYLQPTNMHLPVLSFVTPEQFEEYAAWGMAMGFDWVESGPLVRSSYHAERHIYPRKS
jgi:lipoic acid synthetase